MVDGQQSVMMDQTAKTYQLSFVRILDTEVDACNIIGILYKLQSPFSLGGYMLPSNSSLYGSSGPGTYYLNNVTCFGDTLESCDLEITFSEECLSGEYDYVVECYNYRSECCDSQRILLVYLCSIWL